MDGPLPRPSIAAVIATCNRAGLLGGMLESLCGQTVPSSEFEVVVVDDGSTDRTREVAQAFADRLPIRYSYQRNAGLASARNHGLYLARSPILLFLDDDDVADPSLLEEHLATHRQHPDAGAAVLGYTRLSPALAADPLMHFVTEVGCFLFAYPRLPRDQVLGFDCFWGGRSSCKRAFLIEHGVFNPVFRFGCEDIELAYRLQRHGFHVIYNPHALTTMVRPFTFDQFCARLVRQGRANAAFSRLHPHPDVMRWSDVEGAAKAWRAMGPLAHVMTRAGRRLDAMARARQASGLALTDAETAALHRGYWSAFRIVRLKGIHEATRQFGTAEAGWIAAGAEEEVSMTELEREAQAQRENIAVLGLEVQAQDDTIRGLREQADRQRQVLEAQAEALRRAESQVTAQQQIIETQAAGLRLAEGQIRDMSRSLSWRVAQTVRSAANRLRR